METDYKPDLDQDGRDDRLPKNESVPADKPSAVTQPELDPTVKDREAEHASQTGSDKAIGAPGLFLQDRFRQRWQAGAFQIYEVMRDGPAHGYVMVDRSKVGYFVLTEGMARAEAEAAAAGAFDNVSVAV